MKTQKMTVILRIVLLILIAVAVPAFADTITPNDDCTTRGSTNNNATYPYGLFVKNSDDIGWIEFTIGNDTVSDATLDIYHAWATVPNTWDILIKGAEYSFDETSFTGTSTGS